MFFKISFACFDASSDSLLFLSATKKEAFILFSISSASFLASNANSLLKETKSTSSLISKSSVFIISSSRVKSSIKRLSGNSSKLISGFESSLKTSAKISLSFSTV